MAFTEQQLALIENDKQIIARRFSKDEHELMRFLRGPYFHSVYTTCRCGEYCSHWGYTNNVRFHRISDTYDQCEADLKKRVLKHEHLVSCEKIDAVRSESFLEILCKTFAQENCYSCRRLKGTVIHDIIVSQSIDGSGFDGHRIVDILAAYAKSLGTFFDAPPAYTEEEKIWDADFKWLDPKKIADALALRSYIYYRRKEINYLEGVVRGHNYAIEKEKNNISDAEREIEELRTIPLAQRKDE